MDRIRMPLSKSKEVTVTFRDAFREFVVDATARGLSPKTIRNYELHFHSVSRHMDVDVPLGKLNRNMINEMVVAMRESGLAHNSVSSYTRVVIRAKRGIRERLENNSPAFFYVRNPYRFLCLYSTGVIPVWLRNRR